jgi:hypothetical protein
MGDYFIDETFASRICLAAIREGRCAEMLHVLQIDGGAVTIDPVSYRLVLVSGSVIAQLSEDS